MITIIAKFVIKNEEVNNFKRLAKELVEESRKEEGCISYALHQDVNNKNVLTFIEKWESKDVIEIHNNSVHFTTIIPKLIELQEKDFEINLYEVVV